MIQRIQTLYLLLAAACGFGLLALPLATTPVAIPDSILFADAQFGTKDSMALLVLFAVAGALALAGIFLYKNRQLQLRIARFALVANIVGFLLAVILLWQNLGPIQSADIRDGLGAYLPIGFLIFTMLAIRGINKDEKLVRSMDRLR